MKKRIIAGIRPTRIELLKLRKREILARRGHDLLEEKRNALILELFRAVDAYRVEKAEMERAIGHAYEALDLARMHMGSAAIEEISRAVPPLGEISMEARSLMGVKIPSISDPETISRTGEREYSFFQTSVTLDEAIDRFRDAFRRILRLAETETAVRRLAAEIERTRRRVNALENVLIPRLHATQTYIEMHLQELEREDLFRRKRTKALLAREE